MNEQAIPPLLDPPRPKWRWAVHLALLVGYVLSLGLAGLLMQKETADAGPAMPDSVRDLLVFTASELLVFLAIFVTAWIFSRAKVEEMFLRWRGSIRPILLGLAYSVLLRVGLMVVVAMIAIPYMAFTGEKGAENLRPKTEAIINTEALKNPLYLAVTVTFISFVVAGFREELWRGAVFAGLIGIAPALFASRKGQMAAVLVAAAIFGIGHLPQGIGGVVLTGLLGVGLGAIIVWHRSIWEAVMAHGFFDATTFLGIYVIIRYYPDFLKNAGIAG